MKSSKSASRVKIENPGSLCAAGHITAEIMEQNLNRPDLAHIIKDLELTIHFLAGRMNFTVMFKRGEAEIREGHVGRASVTIRAPFSAMLKLALRRIPWGNIFLLRVYIFGNYFKLLKAAPLLQHHEPVPPELMEGG